MHQRQDANFVPAFCNLEKLIRIGGEELGVTGQQGGIGRRSAAKHWQVDVKPVLLKQSGVTRVEQWHHRRRQHRKGNGDLGELLGLDTKR